MKPGFKSLFLMLLASAGMFGGAGALQHKSIMEWLKENPQFRDSLYLPSSNYVRRVAVGYDMFVSDWLWLRMIQSFAAGWSRPENADQMKHYFDVVTDLDPKFEDAYSFTIMAVGEEANRSDLVKQVVDKAIVNMPGSYKIPYEGAFYSFWNEKSRDVAQAKVYTQIALLDQDHPEFLDRWIPYFDLKDGQYRLAYEKFFMDMIRKANGDSQGIFPILERNLSRSVNDWIAHQIKLRAMKWHEAKGVWPTVEELEQAGELKGIEAPDWARVRQVVDSLMQGPALNAQIDDAAAERIIQSAVRTWDQLPKGPEDFYLPDYQGFVIWPALEPTEDDFVMTKLRALYRTRLMLEGFNSQIGRYISMHEGKCPPSIEMFEPKFSTKPTPLGGNWVLNQDDCKARVSTLPDLDKVEVPNIF